MAPLVSCLMPTADRREFVGRAFKCFQQQTYPELELVVLDDGTDPIADLVPVDPRIRYIRQHSKSNHGQKLNFCNIVANGEFAIVFDDDDAYAPDRVAKQVWPLLLGDKTVSGTSVLNYYIHGQKLCFQYSWPEPQAPWIGAIAFRRDWALAHPFKPIVFGADLEFLKGIPRDKWVDLKDPSYLVCAVHATNAAPKSPQSQAASKYYKPIPWESLPEWFLNA
jgi:glycosyltransferase involved in cell wall biosynthesis